MSIRLAAFGLAVVATFCGMLAAGPILWGMQAGTIAIFAPGYLVTAGYWARTTLNLPCAGRIGVWGISLLVQGAWAMFGVYEFCRYEFDGGLILFLAWWWSATMISAVCLWCEPPESPEWHAVWEGFEMQTHN